MEKQYILFDFDGVIMDSFAPAFQVNKMICPHITEDDYRKRFEGNINDWKKIQQEHTSECRLDIDFFAEYFSVMMDQARVIPDMTEIVEKLSKEYTMIVITSNSGILVDELMRKYDLTKYFVEIMGTEVSKSKVEKIKMVFEKYKTDFSKCVFITDTLGDILEAKENDVGSIAVSWGFQNVETLKRGMPFRIVDKKEDLMVAVSDYFSK